MAAAKATVPLIGSNFALTIGGKDLGNIRTLTFPEGKTYQFSTKLVSANGGPATTNWARTEPTTGPLEVTAVYDSGIHNVLIKTFEAAVFKAAEATQMDKVQGLLVVKNSAGAIQIKYGLLGVQLIKARIGPILDAASTEPILAHFTYNVDTFKMM